MLISEVLWKSSRCRSILSHGLVIFNLLEPVYAQIYLSRNCREMIAFDYIEFANSTILFDLFNEISARIQEVTLLISIRYKKRFYNAVRINYG